MIDDKCQNHEKMRERAIQQYEAQIAADIAHHEARVRWASSEMPKYSCGTPLSKAEIRNILSASTAYLAKPYCANHAPTLNIDTGE